MVSRLINELEKIGRAVEQAEGNSFSVEYLLYLQTPEWQQRRERIQPKICAGCNCTTGLQLHHRCYPPKGSPMKAFIEQPDNQFTWLCKPCHDAIGQSMRARRQPKKRTTTTRRRKP